MADTPTSSVALAWASAASTIDTLLQQLDSAPDNDRELQDRLAAAEDALVDLPAPNIAGVLRKLELLWEQQLHGQDRTSVQKLTILDDLQRLATA
ncbi:hypothetical protein [Novosphingobium decolorationis]|uniref:Uncharacterized protein n=1 Tax=Novosphingobium decolorationis TaxID=2698673 RepID=A0ABX8EB49_9SPHN|nr:hypothetical protein [Novosphingobium decolorationis]QVM85251.1 hypothetical protein HT578_17530 [Novosphingobium decolorationis]